MGARCLRCGAGPEWIEGKVVKGVPEAGPDRAEFEKALDEYVKACRAGLLGGYSDEGRQSLRVRVLNMACGEDK